MSDESREELPPATHRASDAGQEAGGAEAPAKAALPPRAASPTSAIVRSLVRSATTLHHAWSRALMTDDVVAARQEALSFWQSLAIAIAAASTERGQAMAERGAAVLAVQIPLREHDLVTLVEDESDAAALQWLQTAQVMSFMGLMRAMRGIEEPSVEVTTFDVSQGRLSKERFFDSGGLQLLRGRAELLGRIEDELESALDDRARAPLGNSWSGELDMGLSLISIGRHDSALAHLIIALRLLCYWAVPDAASAATPFEELLEACPSLQALAVAVRRAQLIVHGMGDGEPAPLSEAVPIAEVLAASIARLTVVFPRNELRAAMDPSCSP